MPSLAPQPASLARPEGPRRYLVAAPPGETPGGRALIVVLHGGASAEQVLGLAYPPSPLSVWLDIAAREEHDSSRTKCEWVCPTVIIENTLGIASAARIRGVG